MTTMLAVCAFVSFDTVRTLALTWAGLSSATA
jgi:hypothetical protein